MKKLDKKQIPQFAALCVLSAGVFGYFVVKIVTPSPAAAGTRPQSGRRSASQATPAGLRPSQQAGQDGERARTPARRGRGRRARPDAGDARPVRGRLCGPENAARPPAAPAAAPASRPLPQPAKAAAPQVASIHEVGPAPVGAAARLPFGLKDLPPLPAAPAAVAAAPEQALPGPARRRRPGP